MKNITILPVIFLLSACAGGSSHGAKADMVTRLECVPYAREISGIEIYGNAYSWWDRATNKYPRGKAPKPGSVLVLAKTSRLPYGHVAVVKSISGPREIFVSHANWGDDLLGRGYVYENMLVRDVSKENNWALVKFFSPETGKFSPQNFPVRGFIYSNS